MTNSRARILWTLSAFVVITVGTLIAIRFAKGYRPSRDTVVSGNGLLVVNSSPKGARVFVNDRFLTATDNTLYLDPETYLVEIKKDGYFPWKKTVKVEQELVTQANALLFPTAPSLSPFSFSGASKPIPSPDGQRLVFYSASSSTVTKNGFYVMELSDSPLAMQRTPRQITQESSVFPADETTVLWSPDSSQLLLISAKKAVMINPSQLNTVEDLNDISFQLPTTFSQWEEEMYLRDRERLALFPPLMQELATTSAVNVYFSPDEQRILYTATQEFTLPENLVPAKPASSTQPQERSTKVGGIYVYDRDEDRQFRLGTDQQYLDEKALVDQAQADLGKKGKKNAPKNEAITAAHAPKMLLSTDIASAQPLSLEASPSAFKRLQGNTIQETALRFQTYHSPLYSHSYQWFPNSAHFIHHDESGISITEYDGQNPVKVYSGPFQSDFVYPWPNGSRLIILTNFNQGTEVPNNLYTIDLK